MFITEKLKSWGKITKISVTTEQFVIQPSLDKKVKSNQFLASRFFANDLILKLLEKWKNQT